MKRLSERRREYLARYAKEPVCFDRRPKVYAKVNGADGRVGKDAKPRRRIFGVYV